VSTTELQQPEAFRKVDGPTRGGVDPVQAAALASLEALDPPAHLSEPALAENAVAVLEKRYLKKHPETGAVIETPRQAFWRVAAHIAKGELLFPGGTAERALAVAEEFYELMSKRLFMPNSPTLMNAGREMGMLSACFVLPVEDSIDGIFDSIKATALIQKAGGGTGFSFSRLRPRGDLVKSSGGTTEGPLSFIQVFSKATDAIQQGAFRRGANMGILRIDHPDVLEFVRFKDDLDKIQNYNISVAVTNRFLSELARDPATPHQVQNPRTKTWTPLMKRDEHGEPTTTPMTVGELWELIIEHAWRTGEPGVVFIDRINEKNPIKNVGLIEATNPCVTADTWVHTSEGPRQVAELIGRPFVARFQGQDHASAPEGFFATGTKPLVRLETVEGQTLRLTADHRVRRVSRCTRYTLESEWCAAGELRSNDQILLNDHRAKSRWTGDHTFEQGYLIGLLIGDGTLKEDAAVISVWETAGAGVAGVRERAEAAAATLPHRADFDGFHGVTGRAESRLKLAAVHQLARRMGLEPGNKTITPAIERASSDFSRGVLSGLFDADGSVQGDHEKGVSVRLAQSDLGLLRGAQRMLLRHGVVATIYADRRPAGSSELPDGRGGRTRYATRAQHELVISSENLTRFRDEIGFADTDKAVRLETALATYERRQNRERFTARVARIVPDGVEAVYDVQIPGVNAFDANGLVAHNCGEQPLHPYDSCNLGSINLGEFVVGEGRDARFDWGEFKAIVHTTTRFLDNVIEVNKYPLPQIEQMSKTTRRIGLGVMGFADALYKLGLAYDSVEGTRFGEEVMRVLNDESHLASEELAQERGVFPAWDGSDWQARGKRVRNSYTTTVAPTGTISIIAGCSGGIEPMFSLAFIRQVMKDTKGRPTVLREVNHVFEAAAKARGFYSDELIDDISSRGTLQHRAEVPDELKKIFVTAHDIQPHWHMQMQAAFQRHCDSSISKTINFAHDATAEDVRKIYDLAVELDVKGVTVYRDGCRDVQPMALKGSTRKVEEKSATESALADTAFVMTGNGELNPIRLPEIMPSLRIRQMTPFGNMHVKVSVDFTAGKEREVFAQLGKGGDVANSDLEAICRLLSLWLRSNGSLDTALKQLEGIGSSLTVPTKDGRIMSLADGLARALRRYLSAKKEYGLEALLLGRVPSGSLTDGPQEAPKTSASQKQSAQYKIKCPSCAGGLSFEEGCVKCHACGFSQC
jgi:ribonucleoside-diphosphate reductase alpha chain